MTTFSTIYWFQRSPNLEGQLGIEMVLSPAAYGTRGTSGKSPLWDQSAVKKAAMLGVDHLPKRHLSECYDGVHTTRVVSEAFMGLGVLASDEIL